MQLRASMVTGVAMVLLPLSGAVGQTKDTQAAHYPDKAIRLIVPIAPGGGTDILSRIVGQKMSQSLGQQVVIDNRPGAGSIIGTDIVAKSPPDGYTLVMVFPAHAINVSLFKKLPFDPIKDFSPVTLVADATYVLTVHPSLPVHSVKDLIALARARPGELNYASAGNGSSPHLAAELFKSMTHTDILDVPYNGGGPAIAATLAGQSHMTFGVMAAALPFVQNGKLRGLGTTGTHRSPLTPKLPTIAEAGVPGYEADAWYGVLAAARTPEPIINKLDAEIKRVLKLPDVRARLNDLGFEPMESTPRQFAAFIQSEIPKWAKVVKDAGVHVE